MMVAVVVKAKVVKPATEGRSSAQRVHVNHELVEWTEPPQKKKKGEGEDKYIRTPKVSESSTRFVLSTGLRPNTPGEVKAPTGH